MGEAGVRFRAGALAVLLTAGAPPSSAQAPQTAAPPVASPASPPPDLSTPSSAEICGASELAYLVGKPRTEIPVPTDLTRRRVTCEACPAAEDVRPDRQTIVYDQATGRVTRVTCG